MSLSSQVYITASILVKLRAPRTTTPSGIAYSRLPPYIKHQSRKHHTALSPGQSGGDSFSVEVPSCQMTLAYANSFMLMEPASTNGVYKESSVGVIFSAPANILYQGCNTLENWNVCSICLVLEDGEEACNVFLGNMRNSLPGPDPGALSIRTLNGVKWKVTVVLGGRGDHRRWAQQYITEDKHPTKCNTEVLKRSNQMPCLWFWNNEV